MGNAQEWNALLASAALKSMAVLGAAWLLAFALRRSSAAARHLVWIAAAVALLALPFLSLSLPTLQVPVDNAVGFVFQTDARATAAATHAAGGAAATQPAPVQRNLDWRWWLMLIWAAGTAVAFAQMLVGWVSIWRVRRAARAFEDADLPALQESLGIDYPVDVLAAAPNTMPMTFGLLRTAVLMPEEAVEWSRERRRMVLLHELAHVRRGDLAMHLLARTALNCYWWNPLAWMAWRESLKERERAADDLVLSSGARASDYASHLLEIARMMLTPAAGAGAALAMARRSQLEGRLLAILDSDLNRQTTGRAAAWVAGVLALCMVAPLAALRAQNKPEPMPADVEDTIRAAASQKNHEMLDRAAKAAVANQKYDVARKLLDTSLAIRREVDGQVSAGYGAGLIALGDLERMRGNSTEAVAFYQQAVEALGGTPASAPALVRLGSTALVNHENEKAYALLERARGADPAHTAEALVWMGLAQAKQLNAAEAETLFQAALSDADPKSVDSVIAAKVYSSFLRQQGREAESKEFNDRAEATQKAIQVKPAPKPAGSSATYRSGGGVSAPQVIQKQEPEYSQEARFAKVQGTSLLYVEIGPDGVPRNVQVLRPLGLGLDEKAVQAVLNWRFKPGVKDGQPVTVSANIEINWRLL